MTFHYKVIIILLFLITKPLVSCWLLAEESIVSKELLKDSSYVILRNNFSSLQNSFLKVKDFSNLEKNKTELGLIAKDNLSLNDNFQLYSQLRLFNEGVYDNTNHYSNNIKLYIDELYGSISFYDTTLSLGRKKFNSQISYFFPLLDIFSRQKRRDIGYFDKDIESSGQDILDLELIKENHSLYIAYAYDFKDYDKDLTSTKDSDNKKDTIKNAKLLLKATKFVESTNTDLLLLYSNDYDKDQNFSNNTYGFSINQSIGDSLIVYSEYKTVQNTSLMSVYEFNSNYNKKWASEYNLGINYTFSNSINLLLEYYYNGAGYSKREWNSLKNDIDNLSEEAFLLSYYNYFYNDKEYLRKNYLAWRLGGFSLYNFNVDISQNINLDDLSSQMRLGIEKKVSNNINLNAQGSVFFGKYGSENDVIPYGANVLVYIKYFI